MRYRDTRRMQKPIPLLPWRSARDLNTRERYWSSLELCPLFAIQHAALALSIAADSEDLTTTSRASPPAVSRFLEPLAAANGSPVRWMRVSGQHRGSIRSSRAGFLMLFRSLSQVCNTLSSSFASL